MERGNHNHHHCHGVTVINPCCCHDQGEGGGVQRAEVRIRLMEATTFYLRHEGDDSNDGLTPETAFKTWEGMIDGVTAYDFNWKTVTFDIGPGTWTGPFQFSGNTVGAIGNTVFRGAGRGVTVIDAAGGTGFNLYGLMLGGGYGLITSLTIKNHLNGIMAWYNTMFDVDDVEFARCVSTSAAYNIRLYMSSRYVHFTDVSQPRNIYVTDCIAGAHILASSWSDVMLSNHVVHLSGANKWILGCLQAVKGSLITVAHDKFRVTGTGTATGRRYYLNTFGYIMGTGGNQNLFPGDQAGHVDTASHALYLN